MSWLQHIDVLILPETLEYLGTLPLATGLAVTDTVEGSVLVEPVCST